MFVIYEIRNIVNNRYYIGCSKNYEKRKLEHIKKLKGKKHENVHLQKAWNKYGEQNFKFSILYTVDDEFLMFCVEFDLINEGKFLYNIAEGGRGGNLIKNFTTEQRDAFKKIKSAQMKKQYQDGVRKVPEKFDQLSNEERERRLKVWSENKKGSKNGRYKYSKAVLQKDKSGNVIKEWVDLSEIKRDGEFEYRYVRKCCLKIKGYNSHKKYNWEFKN